MLAKLTNYAATVLCSQWVFHEQAECCNAACRTLTPFGFQAEERTLWEATDTYINMSPYLQAHKIKKPLLLIHGEDDNNTGRLLGALLY